MVTPDFIETIRTKEVKVTRNHNKIQDRLFKINSKYPEFSISKALEQVSITDGRTENENKL